MMNFSFNGKRAVAGIGLLLCLLCVANLYWHLGIFGRFEKEVLIATFIIVALVQHFFGLTLQEIKEYRDAKRRKSASRL